MGERRKRDSDGNIRFYSFVILDFGMVGVYLFRIFSSVYVLFARLIKLSATLLLNLVASLERGTMREYLIIFFYLWWTFVN